LDIDTFYFCHRHGTKIAYILSLGVMKDYRKNGIASFMLGNLLSHLRSGDHKEVRAVYLHVLTTNNQAITFYEHRGFKPHLFLPYYYNIKGVTIQD
jgi:ribosomal protein S18 acetylase RimI-like enzyme